MEIKYQTALKNNPVITVTTGDIADGGSYSFSLEPLTLGGIIKLEAIYNSGHQFPASLRELLFLAGKACYVLDYGLYDTQEEMQDDIREVLVERGVTILTRPFFVIDVRSGPSIFLFVYLDEGVNDPVIYEANPHTTVSDPLLSLQASLSTFVNARIDYLLRGVSPY